jgi:hypothetical protein
LAVRFIFSIDSEREQAKKHNPSKEGEEERSKRRLKGSKFETSARNS